MSDSLTGYFYQHWIVDSVGTPLGNNGLAQAPLCNTVNSASQTILLHTERAISANGKTKVGGHWEATLVLVRKVRFAG